MNRRTRILGLLLCTLALVAAGCDNAPGKPRGNDESARPEQVSDFKTLYSQNCAACHGDNGVNGAAISLANPVYIAVAGAANIQHATAAGVTGTLMPGFAKSAGGMLTDTQISILAKGIVTTWGKPMALAGATPPPYAATAPGDASRGQSAFVAACSRCHGADGAGVGSKTSPGSLIDPAYLSLISDQGLRSIVIAGKPEQGMPDWRSQMTGAGAHPLSDEQIGDIVAWLASHRVQTPGQPYQPKP